MQHLPQQAIVEFKEAWKKSFGEDLTDAQASMEATTLLELYAIVSGIDFKMANKDRTIEKLQLESLNKQPSNRDDCVAVTPIHL